jgi:hypothetical protein
MARAGSSRSPRGAETSRALGGETQEAPRNSSANCSLHFSVHRLLHNNPGARHSHRIPALLRASSGRSGRQAERGAVPAGGICNPAPGRPDRPAGHYGPDVREGSLNGFRSASDCSDVGHEVGEFGQARRLLRKRASAVRDPKNAAVERRKACALRHGARDAASRHPNVPIARHVNGAAIRTSASRRSAPLSRGTRWEDRKPRRVGRSVAV